MSFALELPRVRSGTPEEQIAEITRYLHETAAQLNYALGFLDLPGASGNVAVNTTNPGVTTISEKSTNAQQPSAAAVYNFVNGYAVPATRMVNGHPLAEDLTLTAADVSAAPETRTVNGHALTSDVTLTAADVNAVPTARTVNGHALTADLTLTASDLGVADHVVEYGHEGAFDWRIWASGYRECFGEVGAGMMPDVPRQIGAFWVYELAVAYPEGLFAAPPQLSVSAGRANHARCLVGSTDNYESNTKDQATIAFYLPEQPSSVFRVAAFVYAGGVSDMVIRGND